MPPPCPPYPPQGVSKCLDANGRILPRSRSCACKWPRWFWRCDGYSSMLTHQSAVHTEPDAPGDDRPDHDAIKWNRIMISSLCLSMISAQTLFAFVARENRFAIFRIMPWGVNTPGPKIAASNACCGARERYETFWASATLRGKDENLAGTNNIRISNPISVRPVQNRVSCAVAISDAADSPQAVATGYDLHPGRGCHLGWL
jgi:hypothetical protein